MTILLPLISFFLLISFTSCSDYGPCRVFKCNGMSSQAKADNTCVEYNQQEQQEVSVRSCTDQEYCTAQYWLRPSSMHESAYCYKKQREEESEVLPGETCSRDRECFGYQDGAKCHNNACVSAIYDRCHGLKGDPSKGHRWCNFGSYCEETSQECKPTFREHQKCDNSYQCGFGMACIAQSPNFEEFKCTRFHSLKEGDSFDSTNIIERGLFFQPDDICLSQNAFSLGNKKFECRKADRSREQDIDMLERRQGAGEKCHFSSWDDAEDLSKENHNVDYSTCGFNQDISGYCRIRKGDDAFAEVLDQVHKVNFTSLNCHILSGVSTCKALQKAAGNDLTTRWKRMKIVTNPNKEWASFANNDECIKETITAQFWRENSAWIMIQSKEIIITLLVFAFIWI
ncbi:unnamed protein product [Moneuplotes crassus]|uniref:Uncharacterized protein n=1 Tax=Euplotes crassus TaxID=5936 RepID=A0AAD1UFB4_EUPCR|nr:unnamed protein product [Moneuplotes crassus]